MRITPAAPAVAHRAAASELSKLESFIGRTIIHEDTGIDQWELRGSARSSMPAAAKARLAEFKRAATANGGDAAAYKLTAKDVLGGKATGTFYVVRETDSDGANNDNLAVFDQHGTELANARYDEARNRFAWTPVSNHGMPTPARLKEIYAGLVKKAFDHDVQALPKAPTGYTAGMKGVVVSQGVDATQTVFDVKGKLFVRNDVMGLQRWFPLGPAPMF